ncbi:hypothetical protein HY404_01475 [Candidatus Microgenomates bacterium]|nr:hypothetical protein [Candidatus Microgenomates bacterium]
MSAENLSDKTKQSPEEETQSNLLVRVTPDTSPHKKIYTYKRLIGFIEGTFLLDDSGYEGDRYWDGQDKNVPEHHYKNQEDYEISVQLDNQHKGKSVKEVWDSLADGETPLTLLETLYLLKQYPQIIDTLSDAPLLVPATEALYFDIHGWFPCIRIAEGGIYIDLVTSTEKEENFRIPTRKI